MFARDGKSEMQVPFDQILGKSNPLKLPDICAVEAICARRPRMRCQDPNEKFLDAMEGPSAR